MEDQINEAVAYITAAGSTDEAATRYMEFPKAMRRVIYDRLPADIKQKARVKSEEARGIAFRTLGGDLVFSREAFLSEAARLKAKRDEMDERKARLTEKLGELSAKAAKFYGEEFAAEVQAIIA